MSSYSEEDQLVEMRLGLHADPGVSGAILLQDDYETRLAFRARNHKSSDRIGIAIVTFERCILVKFGYPNDEVLPGHPLFEKGVGPYGVFEVLNSSWAKTIAEQNRVTFPDTRDDYAGRHFIFSFHDSTFECLARELKVDLIEGD